jgi:hypothetical protein
VAQLLAATASARTLMKYAAARFLHPTNIRLVPAVTVTQTGRFGQRMAKHALRHEPSPCATAKPEASDRAGKRQQRAASARVPAGGVVDAFGSLQQSVIAFRSQAARALMYDRVMSDAALPLAAATLAGISPDRTQAKRPIRKQDFMFTSDARLRR